jgi:hypothetical protein
MAQNKYRVELSEVMEYAVEVDADDSDQAREIAIDTLTTFDATDYLTGSTGLEAGRVRLV